MLHLTCDGCPGSRGSTESSRSKLNCFYCAGVTSSFTLKLADEQSHERSDVTLAPTCDVTAYTSVRLRQSGASTTGVRFQTTSVYAVGGYGPYGVCACSDKSGVILWRAAHSLLPVGDAISGFTRTSENRFRRIGPRCSRGSNVFSSCLPPQECCWSWSRCGLAVASATPSTRCARQKHNTTPTRTKNT